MPKYPYLPTEPTIPPDRYDGWTDKMRRCHDEGERKRVLYAPDFAFRGHEGYAEQSAAKLCNVLHEATVADIYIRRLPCRGNGIGVHVLVLRRTPDGTAIYFSTVRGGNTDLLANVMAGIPLWLPPGYEVTMGQDGKPNGWRLRDGWVECDAGRPPIILTDHCGLRHVAHPFGEGFDQLTLEGDELARLGYLVL